MKWKHVRGWLSSYLLLLLVGVSAGGSPVSRCTLSDVRFKLYSGVTFTHPDRLLTTKEEVLRIEDCLDLCRTDTSCLSFNYENKLCVTFSSSFSNIPDSGPMTSSPHFTMYGEKVCMRSKVGVCSSSWTMEVVPGFELRENYRSGEAVSSVQCFVLCLEEEGAKCRSSSYLEKTGECRLSTEDRFSLASTSLLSPASGAEYLESNCVEDQGRLCEFREVAGRILRTVDTELRGVGSREDCRKMCNGAKYRCHTYDWGEVGEGVCRLSHHSTASLRRWKEAYLEREGSRSYEMGACYNVSVECTGTGLLTRVRTSTKFNGKLYTKNRPHSCTLDVRESTDFELEIGYNDVNCDVRRDDKGGFSTDLIIQHHNMIITNADIGVVVRCEYALDSSQVRAGLELSTELLHSSGSAEELAAPPNISLRISDRRGQDISFAKVGDPLALRFEIEDPRGPYEIFVRELVAMDGKDTSEILLIDAAGCPTDPSIMGALHPINNAKTLQTNFEAFKFPTSELVQFRALVTPCTPRCEPVLCEVAGYRPSEDRLKSYGRRRRESPDILPGGLTVSSGTVFGEGRRDANSRSRRDTDETVLVANAMRIVDTFHFGDKETSSGTEESEPQSRNFTAAFIWVSLIVVQVGLLISWVLVCRGRYSHTEASQILYTSKPSLSRFINLN